MSMTKILIAIFSAVLIVGLMSCGESDEDKIRKAGERLNYEGNLVFFLPPITQGEAQGFIDYAVESGLMDKESQSAYQLRKSGGNYEIRVSVYEDMNMDKLENTFSKIACKMQKLDVFPSVHWVLTENNISSNWEDVIKRVICQ
jgi:hypothetical protein